MLDHVPNSFLLWMPRFLSEILLCRLTSCLVGSRPSLANINICMNSEVLTFPRDLKHAKTRLAASIDREARDVRNRNHNNGSDASVVNPSNTVTLAER